MGPVQCHRAPVVQIPLKWFLSALSVPLNVASHPITLSMCTVFPVSVIRQGTGLSLPASFTTQDAGLLRK